MSAPAVVLNRISSGESEMFTTMGVANDMAFPVSRNHPSGDDGIEDMTCAIRKAVALPDQIADYLRGMIVSGKWRPGQRIVETRIARELGLGQPTVREALGKLEEAGLVVRTQNSGCRVTQLTAKEYGQIFRVRTAMECLVVELLIENRSTSQAAELKAALHALKIAAASRSVEDFYRADLELHRTMWRLSGNRFLEKALSQLVIPLFAFAMIEIIAHPGFDLVFNARKHDELIRAILSADKSHARRKAEGILKGFWEEGLSLIAEGKAAAEGPKTGALSAREALLICIRARHPSKAETRIWQENAS